MTSLKFTKPDMPLCVLLEPGFGTVS